MSWMITLLRRALWLTILAAVGGAVYSWWRDRSAPPTPDKPEWPPLSATAASSASAGGASAASAEPAAARSSADTTSAVASRPAAPAATSSVVNELVDAPEARPNGADAESDAGSEAGSDDATWIAPDDDGSCPVSHPIKANDNSGIFHVPGGRFYDRTQAERCYTTAEAATADGYRRAKS